MERRSPWFSELAGDVAFALRQIRRRPLFAAASAVVIALGIGVAGAVFAVVDAAWLRPLPFPEPGQLVTLDDREEGLSGAASRRRCRNTGTGSARARSSPHRRRSWSATAR